MCCLLVAGCGLLFVVRRSFLFVVGSLFVVDVVFGLTVVCFPASLCVWCLLLVFFGCFVMFGVWCLLFVDSCLLFVVMRCLLACCLLLVV